MDAGRRAIVGGLATVALETCVLPARADDAATHDLEIRDIEVPGDRALGRRFVVLAPKGQRARLPLLVLLHGRGETGDERTGARAWVDRYGLETSYRRLLYPPVRRTSSRGDFTDARLGAVNAALRARPFRGLAIACPYTPDVNRLPDPERALDDYARWIVQVVIPRAKQEAAIDVDAAHTALDGCSLGGYVGLEVFLRRPQDFAAWGGVQAAFGAHRASGYADRIGRALARVGRRSIHIETSTGDPFRQANEALSNALTRAGVANELLVLPGPHDQPWLREVGTLEMLRYWDGALR